MGGGAAGELELGGTDDDGISVASTQPSVAVDDEETDESKLLLLLAGTWWETSLPKHRMWAHAL